MRNSSQFSIPSAAKVERVQLPVTMCCAPCFCWSLHLNNRAYILAFTSQVVHRPPNMSSQCQQDKNSMWVCMGVFMCAPEGLGP